MSYVNTASLGALGAEAMLYNTGRGIFRPGGYGGGVFDGNIAGLGDLTDWILNPWGSAYVAVKSPSSSDSSSTDAGTSAGTAAGQQAASQASSSSASSGDYPWGTYSAATLALQKATNAMLKMHGYCPITEDGKLGKATCGARLALKSEGGDTAGVANPATCQGFTAPSKPPCGGGGGGGGASQQLTPEQQAALMRSYGGGTDWKKYLLFAGGAAAVLGIAYYVEKKRKKK